MEKFDDRKRDITSYTGIILIIVGYVSFSNYEVIGNLVTLSGALMIIFNKIINHKGKSADSTI